MCYFPKLHVHTANLRLSKSFLLNVVKPLLIRTRSESIHNNYNNTVLLKQDPIAMKFFIWYLNYVVKGVDQSAY